MCMIRYWLRVSSLWQWTRYSRQLQKKWKKWGQLHSGSTNHLTLIACFISHINCILHTLREGKNVHLQHAYLRFWRWQLPPMGLHNWNLRGLCCIISYNTKCIIQHSNHLIRRCCSHPSPPRPRRCLHHACCRRPQICQHDQIHQCYHHHHPHPCWRDPLQVQIHIRYQGNVVATTYKTLCPSFSDLTIELFLTANIVIVHATHCCNHRFVANGTLEVHWHGITLPITSSELLPNSIFWLPHFE